MINLLYVVSASEDFGDSREVRRKKNSFTTSQDMRAGGSRQGRGEERVNKNIPILKYLHYNATFKVHLCKALIPSIIFMS